MTLQILPLQEVDVDTYTRIYHAAFRSGISLFLHPDVAEAAPLIAAGTRSSLLNDPTAHILKVVDTETNEIVACAKWHHYETVRSPEEVAKAAAPPPAPESANNEAWADLFGWLEEARLKFLDGERCWFLSILITDPAHERRGAGTMLLNWACEQADAAGETSYLESGSVAKALYERCGFQALQAREFDLTKYGGQGVDVVTAMTRPASKPSVLEGNVGKP